MNAYALMSANDISIKEPKNYLEVLKSNNKSKWIKAITEEMDSSIKN